MGDAKPRQRLSAVQQWRHRLIVCVQASGEHFERSWKQCKQNDVLTADIAFVLNPELLLTVT